MLIEQSADRLIDALTENHDVYERLTELVDRFGHRVSGSVALEQAIDWIMEEMQGRRARERPWRDRDGTALGSWRGVTTDAAAATEESADAGSRREYRNTSWWSSCRTNGGEQL